MPPQETSRRLSSQAVRIGMLGALSLTLVACSTRSTTAYCADRDNALVSGYRVVPDSYCDGGGSGTYGRYFWYYGGHYRGGYITGGSTVRPKGYKIKSVHGKSLSRGGFGGRSKSGG